MNKTINSEPIKNKYYGHLWYALILPAYLIAFFIVERVISPDRPNMFLSHISFDDFIPFWDFMVTFYILWFPMLFVIGLYLIFRDALGFKRYMTFIGISFFSMIVICLLFPNYQDMRPLNLGESRSVFSYILNRFIYGNDTPTNVLPSVHVLGCFAVSFGVIYSEDLRKKKWLVILTVLLGILVSISTVFVKQHSVLDILAALPIAAICWLIVYVFMFGKTKKQLR